MWKFSVQEGERTTPISCIYAIDVSTSVLIAYYRCGVLYRLFLYGSFHNLRLDKRNHLHTFLFITIDTSGDGVFHNQTKSMETNSYSWLNPPTKVKAIRIISGLLWAMFSISIFEIFNSFDIRTEASEIIVDYIYELFPFMANKTEHYLIYPIIILINLIIGLGLYYTASNKTIRVSVVLLFAPMILSKSVEMIGKLAFDSLIFMEDYWSHALLLGCNLYGFIIMSNNQRINQRQKTLLDVMIALSLYEFVMFISHNIFYFYYVPSILGIPRFFTALHPFGGHAPFTIFITILQTVAILTISNSPIFSGYDKHDYEYSFKPAKKYIYALLMFSALQIIFYTY